MAGRRGLSGLLNDAPRLRRLRLRVARLLDEIDVEFGPVLDIVAAEVPNGREMR